MKGIDGYAEIKEDKDTSIECQETKGDVSILVLTRPVYTKEGAKTVEPTVIRTDVVRRHLARIEKQIALLVDEKKEIDVFMVDAKSAIDAKQGVEGGGYG